MNGQGSLPISKNQLTTLAFAWMLIDIGKTDPANTKMYVISASILVLIYMVKDYLKHKGEK